MDGDFLGKILGDAVEGTLKTISWLFWIAVIAVLGLVTLGVWDIIKWIRPKAKTYESKTILVPTIKLHTDGKTVDTIYVYKWK